MARIHETAMGGLGRKVGACAMAAALACATVGMPLIAHAADTTAAQTKLELVPNETNQTTGNPLNITFSVPAKLTMIVDATGDISSPVIPTAEKLKDNDTEAKKYALYNETEGTGIYLSALKVNINSYYLENDVSKLDESSLYLTVNRENGNSSDEINFGECKQTKTNVTDKKYNLDAKTSNGSGHIIPLKCAGKIGTSLYSTLGSSPMEIGTVDWYFGKGALPA